MPTKTTKQSRPWKRVTIAIAKDSPLYLKLLYLSKKWHCSLQVTARALIQYGWVYSQVLPNIVEAIAECEVKDE